MPNYMRTIIRAPQPVLDALMRDGEVDFETIIPMPEHINRGTLSWEEANRPDGWRRWSLDNWGTKWNAIKVDDGIKPGEITFETAWSHPYPVIAALSKKFPTDLICVVHADEDTGGGVVLYSVLDGDFVKYHPEAYEPEAINIACLIREGQTARQVWSELIKYEPEEYEHIDEDDYLDDKLDPFTLIPERKKA